MKHVHLYLTEEVYEALRKRSFDERKSRSQIVSDLIAKPYVVGTSLAPGILPKAKTEKSFVHKRGDLNPDNYI